MLDTHAPVRLIVRDEPVQVDKAEALVAPGARVSRLVLAETTWTLESVYGPGWVQTGVETMSANTTVIRNAAWIAAWDGERHRYLRDGDVAFAGNRIVHVGGPWEGPADRNIDGSRRFVMPGLVNVHSHPHTEPAFKGVREDHGVPEMYDTGLYERSCAFSLDAAGRQAAMEMAYADLLLCGVTTVVDLSAPVQGWLDCASRSGLRVYIGPFFADAHWKLENRHELGFAWDETRGQRYFEEAIRIMDLAEQHPSGRLHGIVYPGQIETCTESTLRDAAAHARESGRPLTTHLSQSRLEFHEIVRRHGKTPLEYAASIDFLGPGTILGHALFIDEHPDIRWRGSGDLDRLADSGTSVAHCPSPFARYGQAMNHFGRYRARGINMGLGTDVAPHNLVEEMRLAIVLARVMAGSIRTVDTGEMFHAATVGGATALERDDLGRLAPGAKADIVLLDLDHPAMRPARDPLRTFVFEAADRAVRDVFVDGQPVVENGKPLHLDPERAGGELEESQARMLAEAPRRDFLGRTGDAIVPRSLPL